MPLHLAVSNDLHTIMSCQSTCDQCVGGLQHVQDMLNLHNNTLKDKLKLRNCLDLKTVYPKQSVNIWETRQAQITLKQVKAMIASCWLGTYEPQESPAMNTYTACFISCWHNYRPLHMPFTAFPPQWEQEVCRFNIWSTMRIQMPATTLCQQWRIKFQ